MSGDSEGIGMPSIEATRRRVVEQAVTDLEHELHLRLGTADRVVVETVLDRLGMEYPHTRAWEFW